MSTPDRTHSVLIEAPSLQEEALAAAAEELTPDKSLVRAEETAKFVFANVAVVGTVLAGAGLITRVGGAWDRGPHLIGVPLPVLLVAAALLFATLALIPSLRRLDRTDLGAIQRFYTFQLVRRGACALMATIALGGAIASAVASAANQGASSHKLALSAAITGGKAKPTVGGSATVGGLRPKDFLFLSIFATAARGKPMLLCRTAASPGASGTAAVLCPRSSFPSLANVTVEGSLYRNGTLIQRRKLQLSR